MPWAETNDGVRLYYETHGRGEPLLLIGGQAGDHHMWDQVREDFSADHQVIVYDHRGTGASDKPSEPAYSTRGFAADAVAILDALQITRAHAYGISMGGRICQWLGIEHADRIGSLVLGCTTPGDAHGFVRSQRVTELMLATPTPDNARERLELLYTPSWVDAHPELFDEQPAPVPPHARRLHYAASQSHDTFASLPKISAPTLVLHGNDDDLNPTANAQLLADHIAGAELRLFRGGRHAFFEEFRAEASVVVCDFLARHRLP